MKNVHSVDLANDVKSVQVVTGAKAAAFFTLVLVVTNVQPAKIAMAVSNVTIAKIAMIAKQAMIALIAPVVQNVKIA